MKADYAVIWDKCLATIRKNIDEQSFKTWFEPIKPVGINENVLTIQVPNKFFYEWLEQHYIALLKMTIRYELGKSGKLEYQILTPNASRDTTKTASIHKKEVKPIINEANSIKNPFVIPGIRKLKIDPQLKPSLKFENFIEGDCNKLARSAGLAVADRPGETAFNPLFVYGDVGLGKTHLAQAIGNQVIENDASKSVLYVSSDKFTNQLIQSIKSGSVNDFVNFYQMIDVLIVDDIQFLANKVKTQEIFFHLFNQLHQKRKQIILTSDRPPKDLDGMEERLISRFKWGLSADLQAPDFETRIAILQSKMQEEGINISPDVIEFISYNIKNNIRELEGVLISLIAQSSLNGQDIDLLLAKTVIRNFVKEISKEVTVEFIQHLVADHYDIAVEKIQGKTRKQSIVIARQLSMYLAKNLTKSSLKMIGNKFGGRDHSTVIYSCKAVKDMLDTDNMFKDTVEELEKKITLSVT